MKRDVRRANMERPSIPPGTRVRIAALLTLVALTAPVWIPGVVLLIVLTVAGRAIKVITLYALVWTFWLGVSPRRVVFVYSDSPHWKEYVQSRILPRLPEKTVILNWSQRRQWPRFSFPIILFHCFAGEREFNPIGLIFERWRLVEDYRFWQPFRDAKHGQRESLEFVEAQFLRHVAGRR